MATNIDHAAYQAKVKTMTEAELRFTINDAQEALKGHKAGYYADEICYCGDELVRRGLA